MFLKIGVYMLLFDESPYFLPLSYRSVTLFPMVGHSYSHLMSQTELFGTGSTYLQFLLDNKNEIGRNFNCCWLQN